jgi:hypothetical protein
MLTQNNNRSQIGLPLLVLSSNPAIATPFPIAICVVLIATAMGCHHQNPISDDKYLDVQNTKPPVLITVDISPESRVKASVEDIPMELQRGVWKDFLIEVENAAGITAPLVIESEQIQNDVDDYSRDRWLQIELVPNGSLSGERIETRTLRVKSRDVGIRAAILNFNAGQGTQDLGFRSDVLVTFKVCE